MGNNVRIPQALYPEAQRLYAAGKGYRQISAALGVSETSVRRMVGKLEVIRVGGDRRYTERAEEKAAAKKLLRQIPQDTRGLTARIAGDPLPGRSALDQQRGAS